MNTRMIAMTIQGMLSQIVLVFIIADHVYAEEFLSVICQEAMTGK
jgi:hypothetical protein